MTQPTTLPQKVWTSMWCIQHPVSPIFSTSICTSSTR